MSPLEPSDADEKNLAVTNLGGALNCILDDKPVDNDIFVDEHVTPKFEFGNELIIFDDTLVNGVFETTLRSLVTLLPPENTMLPSVIIFSEKGKKFLNVNKVLGKMNFFWKLIVSD